jgi:hypothetical protein
MVKFTLGIDSMQTEEVSQIRLMSSFTGEDSAYSSRAVETYTNFPAQVELKLTELVNLFDNLTLNSLKPGDRFDFTMEITTESGRTFTRVSPDLNLLQTPNTAYTPSFILGCPSELPVEGKTYTVANVVEVPFPCCGLSAGTYTGTATVTNQGQGVYLVSDFQTGALALGGVDEDPVNLVDVCQKYSLDNTPSALAYSANGMITYDEATGVFTIPYKHSSGFKGVATLTPKN